MKYKTSRIHTERGSFGVSGGNRTHNDALGGYICP